MSSDLERVRSDLSLMSQWLGLRCPWGIADVRFGAALSAVFGMYAALRWPGSPIEVPGRLAAVPVFAALAAYCGYMAVKARRLPAREASRRREYQSGLVAALCIVPLTVAYRFWCDRLGMTASQSGGIVMGLMGAAFFIIGVACPPLRYPRSCFLIGGELMLFGPAISLAPAECRSALIGLMGLVVLGSVTIVAYRHLQRQISAESQHAAD